MRNGDATGAEIVRALSERTKQDPNIEIWDDHFVIDLITQDGECYGALVQKPDGQRVFVRGNATILCSGGAGQLFRYTTNPEIATGDGIAIAYRAGAQIQDVEFIQFHPTALCYPGAPRFLISEAVRGEGAYLAQYQRRALHGAIIILSWSLRRGMLLPVRSSTRWRTANQLSSILILRMNPKN